MWLSNVPTLHHIKVLPFHSPPHWDFFNFFKVSHKKSFNVSFANVKFGYLTQFSTYTNLQKCITNQLGHFFTTCVICGKMCNIIRCGNGVKVERFHYFPRQFFYSRCLCVGQTTNSNCCVLNQASFSMTLMATKNKHMH